jgi:hypothetical protein
MSSFVKFRPMFRDEFSGLGVSQLWRNFGKRAEHETVL